MRVLNFQAMKLNQQKISMVTCYDFWSAQIVDESDVDCVLVGDSAAMIMHGHETTIPADLEMMALHIRAVSAGARTKFIVADMPFLSLRCGLTTAMRSVDALMKAGAHSVKIEGIDGQEDIVKHVTESGIPVMGHLGLTPQSIHQLGGFRVQGKGKQAADRLKNQALRVQEAGCFAVVLECVRADVVEAITKLLAIPTIGIGAGPATDGQVLVLHDLLDLFRNVDPKFVRRYLNGHELILKALNQYNEDVKSGSFPSQGESYE